MSDAMVTFARLGSLDADIGSEQTFGFNCPLHKGRRCEGLIIAGRTTLKRDPEGKNGGVAQWNWDGNNDRPSFSPSINCTGCWHGYIQHGRCLNTAQQDEPEPK